MLTHCATYLNSMQKTLQCIVLNLSTSFFENQDNCTLALALLICNLLYFLNFTTIILEIGKQQFLEAGGLESLREFSYKSIFDDKRWDRLLNRACTVLCKVCQAKPLPVEVEMSPAKFNIPDGHLVMPEGKSRIFKHTKFFSQSRTLGQKPTFNPENHFILRSQKYEFCEN